VEKEGYEALTMRRLEMSLVDQQRSHGDGSWVVSHDHTGNRPLA
jgi:hypothetical protein